MILLVFRLDEKTRWKSKMAKEKSIAHTTSHSLTHLDVCECLLIKWNKCDFHFVIDELSINSNLWLIENAWHSLCCGWFRVVLAFYFLFSRVYCVCYRFWYSDKDRNSLLESNKERERERYIPAGPGLPGGPGGPSMIPVGNWSPLNVVVKPLSPLSPCSPYGNCFWWLLLVRIVGSGWYWTSEWTRKR